MKHPAENPLLKEILAGEPLAGLQHASLQQGLVAMRRARRIRRAMRVGLFALLPVLAILALTRHNRIQETTSPPSRPGPPSGILAAAAPEKPGAKMISDEELFALFPGRSLALIGKPGQQQLVVLDAPASR